MPTSRPNRFLARTIADEKGVALPLALLGLVAASIVVTTALVTSSTEVALSRAHQDAVAGLYVAEGALEQFVARKAALAAAGTDSLHPVTDDARIAGTLVTAARLHEIIFQTADDTIRQNSTFSLLGRPSSGRGRSVGVLVGTQRKAKLFKVDVNAGLTVGGDISVSGSSVISDGRNAVCDSAAAPNALQVTQGSTIKREGNAKIEGKADTATFSKEELVTRMLGGMTLPEAARYATIKFAPGEYSSKARSYDGSAVRDRNHKYNWGCPAGHGCATVVGNEANRGYYPTVAIDAGGGTVVIEGDHGQGVLIIYNGSVQIKGNLTYQGIVLVEKDLLIEGTGGSSGGVKVEGAVLALGQNSTVQDNASGNAVITYNKCIITDAQAAANTQRLASAPQAFPARTYGWFEVVR